MRTVFCAALCLVLVMTQAASADGDAAVEVITDIREAVEGAGSGEGGSASTLRSDSQEFARALREQDRSRRDPNPPRPPHRSRFGPPPQPLGTQHFEPALPYRVPPQARHDTHHGHPYRPHQATRPERDELLYTKAFELERIAHELDMHGAHGEADQVRRAAGALRASARRDPKRPRRGGPAPARGERRRERPASGPQPLEQRT